MVEIIRDNKKITLMLPTYNRCWLLMNCIESILNQSNQNFKLIISDNCSTDGTKEYLQSLKTNEKISITFAEKNIGLIRNLEKCIRFAETEWVVFVADDDLCKINFVEELLKSIENTESCLILPSFEGKSDKGEVTYRHKLKKEIFSDFEALRLALQVPPPRKQNLATAGIFACAMRKEKLLKCLPLKDYPGGFFIDTFLILSLMMEGSTKTIDGLIYERMEWSGSITNDEKAKINIRKARKLFINDFQEKFVKRSIEWEGGKRNLILEMIKQYEDYDPFSLKQNIISKITSINRLIKKIFTAFPAYKDL